MSVTVKLILKGAGALSGVLLIAGAAKTYHKSSTFQMGAPGVAMQIVDTNERLDLKAEANAVPPSLPPASPGGQLAVDAYKNVQVLGHISAGDFTRLMTGITTWVAPNQGCAYCHAPQRDAAGNIVKDEDGNPQADLNRMWSDELYTKRVARRMLQMTMRINGEWKDHVKATGVTCYTCHRGNPVPANIWFDASDEGTPMIGNRAGQNGPSSVAGLASLPAAPLRPYLVNDENIRVIGKEALPSDNRQSIKQAEWTYALMMYMSSSLGVNCTYCHNSRSMGEWTTSPPTRATAWFGIRMVRELNKDYLLPIRDALPESRLGPTGDAPKAGCATCHQGAYKPLLGVSMLKDYPVLAEAKPQPTKTVAAPETPPMPGLGDAGAALLGGDAGAPVAGDAGVQGAPLVTDAGLPGPGSRTQGKPDAGR